jgi:hypothetical protein
MRVLRADIQVPPRGPCTRSRSTLRHYINKQHKHTYSSKGRLGGNPKTTRTPERCSAEPSIAGSQLRLAKHVSRCGWVGQKRDPWCCCLLPGEPCPMRGYGRGARRRREERKIVMQVTVQVTISNASSAYATSACAHVEWLPLSLAPVHYDSCAIDAHLSSGRSRDMIRLHV